MFHEQRARIIKNRGLAEIFNEPCGRRAFLTHTLRAGLTGGLASALASCDNAQSTSQCSGDTGAQGTLNWIHERDNGLYQQLVLDFQAHHPSIRIQHHSGDPDTAVHHDEVVAQLKQKQVDIISLDVTWIDEFVRQQWILPLDQFCPPLDTTQYLSTPVEVARVGGKVYAAPFRSDIGLLFYRTDLISQPPTTWGELEDMARKVQKQQKSQIYGYVWQGAPFEGLFCNFLEVYFGCGGQGLDVQRPETFVADAAVQALTLMQEWISAGISPQTITHPISDWTQDRALNEWINGNAVFMRNWTYAIAQTNLSPTKSQVAGHFGIAPLPGASAPGRSCVGGWQLAICNSSSPAQQQAAWTFISYLMQHNAQEYAATQGTFLVTLKDIYKDDPIVGKQQPLVEKLPAILNKAGSRPRSPCYQSTHGVSQIIYNQLHKALTDSRYLGNPQSALQDLQQQLAAFKC
ncbi:MAG TPA: ABC transporter substrate-binding protein [Ktedonobacteraceae bacterium]